MMKKIIHFLLYITFCNPATAQKTTEDYTKVNDSLQIGEGSSDFIPFNEKGYTLILPAPRIPVKGIIISLEDSRFDLQNSNTTRFIHTQANKKGLAVIYLSTGIPVDLYFSEQSLIDVDEMLKDILGKHHLENKNIFFLGVSVSGHRALQYIKFCYSGKSKFNPDTIGIVLCESALDWTRMWYEGKKGIRDNFAESAMFEGRLVTYLLEKNLDGTPLTKPVNYANFSSYSYFDEDKTDIDAIKNYAVRTYSEQATYYWMEKKGKTVFDTNFPDMVGIINELKLAGNQRAEFIQFSNDRKDMSVRNPNHTWSQVNKAELVSWMITQLK